MRSLEIKSVGRLACIVAVFGVVQFIFLTFLAALFYPGGFDYFGYYFSDLGAVVARNGESNSISSTLFPVTLTVIALALIPFWLIIHPLFTESRVEKVLSILGSATRSDKLSFHNRGRLIPNRHSIGNSYSHDPNLLFTLYVSYSSIFDSHHIESKLSQLFRTCGLGFVCYLSRDSYGPSCSLCTLSANNRRLWLFYLGANTNIPCLEFRWKET